MIHVLVGVQGSGKSTYAREFAKKENIEVVSTDAVRKAYPGIEEYKVWDIVYEKMAKCLKEGKDCIFDATSITRKVRKRFFDSVGSFGVEVKADCIYLDTNIETCEKRVLKRNDDPNELYLPPEVIFSYHERLEIPTVEEGFEKIVVVKDYTFE